MKPRTREARLVANDDQGREWFIRWVPGDQVFVAKRKRHRGEFIVPAARLCAMFVAEETPLFPGEHE